MKLTTEFIRLPYRFDAARLQQEVAGFAEAQWRGHPSGFEGNSAIPLISAGGTDNDAVGGAMLPTPHLARCPYIQQILGHFGVVWSRSRLMRLGARSTVPQHSDINYHWFHRVRIHIPITTWPDVRFYCGDRSVHMAAGEAWLFDNWRQHRVENPTDETRIHLVADTTGTARFWQVAAQAQTQRADGTSPTNPEQVAFSPGATRPLITERFNVARVMHPSEIELLLDDLRRDLAIESEGEADRFALARFHALMDGLCQEWRALWSVYADEQPGWKEYTTLRDYVSREVDALQRPIYMRSNGVLARNVLDARVLNHLLNLPGAAARAEAEYTEGRTRKPAPRVGAGRGPRAAAEIPRSGAASDPFDRPIFIVAAPRSGSTLLFETLACSSTLWTVGGETHTLIESLPELRPGAAGVDSNRLRAEHATAAVAWHIKSGLLAELRDAGGRPYEPGHVARFLEKTPKNALRIPFFMQLFPDAVFVFLWRDPRQNISSIMDAWRSGRWITYPDLPGWNGPWSLLLPPRWQELTGKELEEIAGYQWECTNRCILDDLGALHRSRWTTVEYDDLVRCPREVIERICTFAAIPFDEELRARTSAALPTSKYTLSQPDPDKWRRNAAAIERVLPNLQETWARLRGLA